MTAAQGSSTELLSIGELAERSGLSRKALRMYDDSGLLPARAVDPFTGYRRYGPEQVARARLIATLRGVGMGLPRIGVVMELPAAAAAQEIRSWWHQEHADALSRGEAVAVLLDQLGHAPKENSMSTTDLSAQVASRTHLGSVREEQQDAVLHAMLPGGALLIAVADGFGTGSSIAQQTLHAFHHHLEDLHDQETPPSLPAAMESAWGTCKALIQEGEGTTLTAAVVSGQTLHVAHIGDTRLILVQGSRLDPVTQDHTHVRSLVAAGRLTAEEALDHPQRAVLNRALSDGAPTAPDLLTRHLVDVTRLVLLSDGVHAVVPPEVVAEVVTSERDPERAVESLVDAALAGGGPDNVAVVIADLSALSGR